MGPVVTNAVSTATGSLNCSSVFSPLLPPPLQPARENKALDAKRIVMMDRFVRLAGAHSNTRPSSRRDLLLTLRRFNLLPKSKSLRDDGIRDAGEGQPGIRTNEAAIRDPKLKFQNLKAASPRPPSSVPPS